MQTVLDLKRLNRGTAVAVSTALRDDDMPLRPELEAHALDRTVQLQELNEELEAFSWSVAHDLTAPLVQILGCLRSLNGHCRATRDDVALKYLAQIQGCAERMTRLTQDLLRLARIDRTELCSRRVDMSRIAREIAANLSARSPARHVEWLIAIGLEAEADPGLIEVLLENLLSNAWKYTSHCSRARIEFGTVPQTESPVEYYVRDNGAGFDMTLAGRLFQPFERLHTVDEFPGAGIGLATAKRIVQRHGGRIRAESEVGRGATFLFTLHS